MALYVEQLEGILVYLKHLNNAEDELMEKGMTETYRHPELSSISVSVLGDDQPIGTLVDEIGGHWAFEPEVVTNA